MLFFLFISLLLSFPGLQRNRLTACVSYHLVGLDVVGPSREFVQAWRKVPKELQCNTRSQLYYVNHSPWKHRASVFDTVNKNFGGTLENLFCSRKQGCEPPKERLSMPALIHELLTSAFVESPPGQGEDCYRHYEVMGAVA